MADINGAGQAPGPSRSLGLWAPPTPGHGVIGAEAATAELLQLAVRIRPSGAARCSPEQRSPPGQRSEVETSDSAGASGGGGGFRVTASHKAAGWVLSPVGRRARSPGLPRVPRLEGVARGTLCELGLPALGCGAAGFAHSSLSPSCLSLGRAEVSWGGGCTWHSGAGTSSGPGGENPSLAFHPGLWEPRDLEEGPHSGIPPSALGTHLHGVRTPFSAPTRSCRNPLA